MSKWISVKSKKKPRKFVNVLAYSKKGSMRITCVMSNGKFDDYELESDGNDRWTHWQPLPSPPATNKHL